MLKHEMGWMVKYFLYPESQWEEQRKGIADDMVGAAGLRCYAAKQARLWRAFSEKAIAWFQVAIPELQFADQ